MNISQRGVDLIKSFEGYKKALPDGSCTTYYCPAGKLTIGFGCTEGISQGDIWSKEKAEQNLKLEISKHTMAVMRLVSVDLNQNQFDALVSFSFNAGIGSLSKSTLLKKLNKGDYAGAQAQFLVWNKHEDPKTKKKVPSRGLSIRRAKEAALFAERTDEEIETYEGTMPQAVAAPKEPLSPNLKMGLGLTGGAAVPAVPSLFSDSLSNIGAWKGATETLGAFAKAAVASPVASLTVIGIIAAIFIVPRFIGETS